MRTFIQMHTRMNLRFGVYVFIHGICAVIFGVRVLLLCSFQSVFIFSKCVCICNRIYVYVYTSVLDAYSSSCSYLLKFVGIFVFVFMCIFFFLLLCVVRTPDFAFHIFTFTCTFSFTSTFELAFARALTLTFIHFYTYLLCLHFGVYSHVSISICIYREMSAHAWIKYTCKQVGTHGCVYIYMCAHLLHHTDFQFVLLVIHVIYIYIVVS